ncbi:MAG: PHP domain-containing protein [Candidatus Methanofastidiosa archaeon]|nr:PHP domain-containing protein [Candidatus Methanofastidiosa archaeon]
MFKIDMHVHTYYSYGDGINSPEEMIRAAEAKGLDGIAITDHDNIEGAQEAMSVDTGLLVVAGAEVSSLEGHILAYGIHENVPMGLSARETIEAIHGQGGIAVAAHPFDHRRSAVGELIFQLPFDGVEALNGHFLKDGGSTKRICQEHSFPMTAGTDAHMAKEIGSCYTVLGNLDDYKAEIVSGRSAVEGKPVPALMLFEKWLRTYVLRQGKFL